MRSCKSPPYGFLLLCSEGKSSLVGVKAVEKSKGLLTKGLLWNGYCLQLLK